MADERYAAGAWMRRSGVFQVGRAHADERYAAGAWMRRSGIFQVGRAHADEPGHFMFLFFSRIFLGCLSLALVYFVPSWGGATINNGIFMTVHRGKQNLRNHSVKILCFVL
jgi:hypothetical protein